MDVKVDATLRWDGVAPARPGRARRFFAGLIVAIAVLAVVASVLWFLRAFVVPPTISISGPMTLAGAPPEAPAPPAATDGRASVPETAPQPAQSAAQESSQGSAAPAPADSGPPPPLPMMQSLALAPPMLTFSAPPPNSATPSPEQIEPGVPIAGPIPLPPRRPRASAARSAAPVPLPRPAQ